MKKIIDPLPAGGAPIFATETVSEILTKEVWDAMESLFELLHGSLYLRGTTSGVGGIILSGCEVTPQGGNLYDVSAGILFHPTVGIARYAGATGISTTLSIYLNPDTPVVEQKTFADAGVKDYSTTISTAVSTSVGLTGGVRIVVDSNTVVWRPTLDNILASLTGDTLTRRYIITDWDMDTDAVYPISITYDSSRDIASKLKIVNMHCWVKQDGTTSQHFVNLERPASGGTEYGYIEVIANDGVDNGFVINLNRITSGYFDSANFSANGTRGYVTVTYAINL